MRARMRECVRAARYHAAPLLPFLFPFPSLAHLPAMPATAMINSNFVLTALRFRVCNALAFMYYVRIKLFIFENSDEGIAVFSTNART